MSAKYIRMAADEELWICDTEGPQLAALLNDPGTWIEENVPNAEPSMTGHYFIEFSTSRPDDGKLIVKGMSGTALIIVTGHEIAHATFATGVGLPPEPEGFWSSLDQALASHLKFPVIEFFLLREFGRIFVHLQINPDRGFLATFMSQIAQDQVSYINWLQDTTGVVPRIVREVLADGTQRELPMSSLRIVPKGTLHDGPIQNARMFFENLSTGICPAWAPYPVACDGADGPIYIDASGQTVAELELIFLKVYCTSEPGP